MGVVDNFRRVHAVISESSILHGHPKILGESFMGVLIIRYGFILRLNFEFEIFQCLNW